MEFWGVEIKAGEPLKVRPDFGKLLHISQAALGEVKDVKGAKYIPLRLKIDDKNFIIGSLSAEGRTQLMFDLVFEREFELSHDWKNGSVYFIGYYADEPASDDEFSDFEDESEDEPVETKENGKNMSKPEIVKVAKSAPAAKAKVGTKKEEQPESNDDEDDSESDSDDEMTLGGLQEGDSSDVSGEASEEDEDDSSEEELPKAQQSKKRPAEAEQRTPVPAKKAKPATPEKSGSKGHTATPFPSKAAGNKLKEQTPKSGGQLACKSCSKTFTSGNALQSHTKAKHGGK